MTESSETSDLELEGMDLEEEVIEEEEDAMDMTSVDQQSIPPPEPVSALKLQEAERMELEEARKERMELIAAESNKISTQDRLAYLMAQSDVFAHFLAGKL
jgi:hypothetical protein